MSGADVARRDVLIVNQRGLHARASAAFAREAGAFTCRITVRHLALAANGASIMELLTLGAACGDTIRIEAEGEGAQAAADALVALVAGRFGEST
ncbi:HPr family phosphocarrier protein [bacterium]|nr:HPr family phosphocarrier protein [bacterium]